MIDELVTSHLDVLGGRRVFRGTRVHIEALFENLADGMALGETLDPFPTLVLADVVRMLGLTAAQLKHPRAG